MRRTGFTLVELLAVIVIIAVLTIILTRVLHAVRQESRTVVCGSNLRQLSLALTVYDQENGTFPYGFDSSAVGTIGAPPYYPGNSLYDWAGRWWFQFIDGGREEDFGKGTVFWCPSRCVEDLRLKPNILCGNYGVNRAICKDALSMGSEFVGRPLSLYQILRPSGTLLITDSGYSLISWRGATDASVQRFENVGREGAFYVPGLRINKERSLFPGHEQDAIDGRHPNKSVNVGFVDGHISRIKADDLFVKKTGGNYSNRSPLWLPKQSRID